MKKVGKVFSRLIIFGLMIAILYMLVKGRKSNYSGAPLQTVMGAAAKAGPGDIFAIKSDAKCVPGPGSESAYYTEDLTAGGLCGDQDFVRNQMRDWTISSGIGGTLFDRLG